MLGPDPWSRGQQKSNDSRKYLDSSDTKLRNVGNLDSTKSLLRKTLLGLTQQVKGTCCQCPELGLPVPNDGRERTDSSKLSLSPLHAHSGIYLHKPNFNLRIFSRKCYIVNKPS